jgi:NADPH2:quinone reductase
LWLCLKQDKIQKSHRNLHTMKAVVYNRDLNSFELSSIPIPNPAGDEIRVKVYACALNPVDAKVNNWKGGISPEVTNVVLGLDVCGLIDAVGSDVEHLSKGQLVLFHGRMFKATGGFAEYAIHDASTVVVIDLSRLCPPQEPSVFSSLNVDSHRDVIIKLAASPCAAWTAFQGMFDCMRLSREKSVNAELAIAIMGASGGVGSFALQFARQCGFKHVIGICSRKNHEHALALGATSVVDYTSEDVRKTVNLITGGDGVDVLIDCVGSATTRMMAECVRYGGIILPCVSFADFGDLRCFMKSITIAQVSLGGAHSGGLRARRRLQSIGEEVTQMILENLVEVPVTSIVSIEEVGGCLVEMLKANSTGKIVMSLI